MRLARQIVEISDNATQGLTLADNAIGDVLAVIHVQLSTPHLQAQSYDGVRVSGCGTEEAVDEDGVKRSGPVMPDPIGREVAGGLDTEDEILRALLSRYRVINDQVTALLKDLRTWQDIEHLMLTPRTELAREAAEAALLEARLTRENERTCRSCARADIRVTDIYRRGDVGGRLDDVADLCRWCYRKVEELGALPPIEWVERHHRGEVVRVRA